MAKFEYEQKITLLPPKVNLKGKTEKMRKATQRVITRGRVKASSYVATALGEALDTAITTQTWVWPNITHRQNGEWVGTPRDIYDTGKLMKSLKIVDKHLVTKSTITVNYMSPYARLVHYGGKIIPYGDVSREPVFIPGRPWIDAVLNGTKGFKKFNIAKPMNQGFGEEWTRAFG